MKKVQSVLGLLALFLLFSSAFTPAKTGLKEGLQAPKFNVQNAVADFNLNAPKGQFVLINFWAGYDAPSRMNNIRYAHAVNKIENSNIALVSVSFDTNKNIFEEMIKRDGLNPTTQFYDREGKESELFNSYRLDQGFASYLISPEGVIIAKNPNPDHLTNLIRQ